MGTEFFFFFMVELTKVLGGLLVPMKVTMEMNQVLVEQGDLLYKYLETILQGMTFLNSFILLQMDRLQLTAVYCNRRGCKYHTSNDVLSWCNSVHKMATEKSDDELIQSDNNMRIGTRSGQIHNSG